MKNGYIGYSQWKENRFRQEKDKDKERDIDYDVCADALVDTLEKRVESFFAIEISQVFQNNFEEAVRRIKGHMLTTYHTTEHLEEIKTHEEETKKHDEEDLYDEVSAAKRFIDWVKEGLAISVMRVSDNTYHFLALTFPDETSKNIFLDLIGGKKNFTVGPLSGRACPNHDESNLRMLKFPLIIQADGKTCVALPTQEMARKVFNRLPDLATQLGAVSYSTPAVPVPNPKNPPANTPINVSITYSFTASPSFSIRTPEFFFGYKQVLVVADFPETIKPGTLYVKLHDEEFKKMSIQSTGLPSARELEYQQIRQIENLIAPKGTSINFKKLKHTPINIPQNTETFVKLVSIFRVNGSALTQQFGTSPRMGIFGEDRIPEGQALTLSEFHKAAIDEKLHETKEILTGAEAVYDHESQVDAKLTAKVELALQDLKETQGEYKSAQQAVEKIKAEHRAKGREANIAKLEYKVASLISKSEKSEKLKEKATNATKEYESIGLTLRNAEQAVVHTQSQLLKARAKFNETSQKKLDQGKVTAKALEQLSIANTVTRSMGKEKEAFRSASKGKPNVSPSMR